MTAMAEINFELYNNTLIQQLVGPQDSHLRLLEKILGVEIGSFGNQMTIKGPAEAIEQAKTAMTSFTTRSAKVLKSTNKR